MSKEDIKDQNLIIAFLNLSLPYYQTILVPLQF